MITVQPESAIRRSARINSAAVAGSSPEVGSSRKKNRGRASNSTAMLARLRSPPLNRPTRTFSRSLSRAAHGQSRVDRLLDLRISHAGGQPQPSRIAQDPPQRQVAVNDVFLRHETECTRPEPARRTTPVLAGRRPANVSSKVVFPAPLGPMIATN